MLCRDVYLGIAVTVVKMIVAVVGSLAAVDWLAGNAFAGLYILLYLLDLAVVVYPPAVVAAFYFCGSSILRLKRSFEAKCIVFVT